MGLSYAGDCHRQSEATASNSGITVSNKQNVIVAFNGLALAVLGLVLAILSNPARFSINVADDRNIQLFALTGFVCTLVGSLLFLFSVRNTTSSMPWQLQKNANVGVGLGFVLQIAGFFFPEFNGFPLEIGLALIVSGLAVFVWGTINYARGKGYSKSIGLLGVLGILGLIVLVLLPQTKRSDTAEASNSEAGCGASRF
ncbi:hypothetical protein Pla144_11780 [Bythopirellula polymerisocia]|uniref:Uncharacterized protein n=1 Tax=Bythopirellula polymerisocia TaxID=2528003 RepID=A0A5C6D0G7_9BACT|nr:hypothetical protein Pla144_11780 [Bythopirellula polymerisocia]